MSLAVGFIHIIFGIYGGSEPEAVATPDSIFFTDIAAGIPAFESITATAPAFYSITATLPTFENITIAENPE